MVEDGVACTIWRHPRSSLHQYRCCLFIFRSYLHDTIVTGICFLWVGWLSICTISRSSLLYGVSELSFTLFFELCCHRKQFNGKIVLVALVFYFSVPSPCLLLFIFCWEAAESLFVPLWLTKMLHSGIRSIKELLWPCVLLYYPTWSLLFIPCWDPEPSVFVLLHLGPS